MNYRMLKPWMGRRWLDRCQLSIIKCQPLRTQVGKQLFDMTLRVTIPMLANFSLTFFTPFAMYPSLRISTFKALGTALS